MLRFNFEMLRFNFEMLRFNFEMLRFNLKCSLGFSRPLDKHPVNEQRGAEPAQPAHISVCRVQPLAEFSQAERSEAPPREARQAP